MPNLLTEQEAAPLMGLKVSTLQKLRMTDGAGPRFIKVLSSVRYRERDIEEWIAARVVTSTAKRNVA